MYFGVFLDGRIARGIINLTPQHHRSLQGLAFLADPGGECFHPHHRARLLARSQESICPPPIVLPRKVIAGTEISVKAPLFRDRANSPLPPLHPYLPPPSPLAQ